MTNTDMGECMFCRGSFRQDELTVVVAPGGADEPNMVAEACGRCWDRIRLHQARVARPLGLGALARSVEGITLSVELSTSEYGTQRPTVFLRAPRETPWRRVSAARYAIAALVEQESPSRAGWITVVTPGEEPCVYLELVRGTGDEAERGMEFLRTLVARLGHLPVEPGSSD